MNRSTGMRVLCISVAAALMALLVISAGCGTDGGSTTGTTGAQTVKTSATTTGAATTRTAGADSAGTSTEAGAGASGETPAGGAESGSSGAGAGATLEIIERSVSPEMVAPGAMMTYTASIRGTATSAEMRAYNRNSGELAVVCALSPGATVGDVTTWSGTAAAPMTVGEYRYYASATGPGGSVEMPGVSGWTFCVGSAADCS